MLSYELDFTFSNFHSSFSIDMKFFRTRHSDTSIAKWPNIRTLKASKMDASSENRCPICYLLLYSTDGNTEPYQYQALRMHAQIWVVIPRANQMRTPSDSRFSHSLHSTFTLPLFQTIPNISRDQITLYRAKSPKRYAVSPSDNDYLQ